MKKPIFICGVRTRCCRTVLRSWTHGDLNTRAISFGKKCARNVTELLLFGIKKKSAPNRTLAPARSQVNLIRTMKREHSRKPDEIIPIIESCSLEPRIELFARGDREGWDMWGDQATADYEPDWPTYANHTISKEMKSISSLPIAK